MTIDWSRAGRIAIDILLWLAVLTLGYGAAGLVGGSIPVNAAWRPPAAGVTIYVETNGVHTDLVVPVAAADGEVADNEWELLRKYVDEAHNLCEVDRARLRAQLRWLLACPPSAAGGSSTRSPPSWTTAERR